MGRYTVKALIVWLILAGCQSWTPQRSVDAQNTFTSTHYPEVSISIDPDFTYIGTVKHSKYKQHSDSSKGATWRYQTFIFGSKGMDDRLQRGVIIRISELSEGNFLPDLFANRKHQLGSGITSIGGQNYQYAVYPSKRPFFKFEENYLFDHGSVLSSNFVAKAFSRREGIDNNYCFEIIYVESLDSFQKGKTRFRDWTRRKYLSGEQKEFLKTLEETCNRCVVVSPITDEK